MRKAGKTWPEVTAALGKGTGYSQTLRPVMKELDPSSVAPSYDRAKVKAKRGRASK